MLTPFAMETLMKMQEEATEKNSRQTWMWMQERAQDGYSNSNNYERLLLTSNQPVMACCSACC